MKSTQMKSQHSVVNNNQPQSTRSQIICLWIARTESTLLRVLQSSMHENIVRTSSKPKNAIVLIVTLVYSNPFQMHHLQPVSTICKGGSCSSPCCTAQCGSDGAAAENSSLKVCFHCGLCGTCVLRLYSECPAELAHGPCSDV